MTEDSKLADEILPSQATRYAGGSTEEILGSITHAVGAGMAIVGYAALLIRTGRNPTIEKYLGFSIYGIVQVLLYVSSALTHGFAQRPKLRRFFSTFDLTLIYVLIAATYTPLCLISLSRPVGWASLAILWTLASVGVVLRVRFRDRFRTIADVLYGPMALFILLILGPVARTTSSRFVVLAVIGLGLLSVGATFYLWKRLPYSHVVWHLFVMAGGATVFAAYFEVIA